MTLSEIATLCPPPEGCYWFESDDGVYVLRETDERSLRVIIKDLSLDDRDRWSVAAENFEVEARIRLITTRADLPAACRRALTAVGLAPDAEKARLRESLASLNVAHDVAVKHIGKLASENADFRRRLTWTSEVPTEPGVYVVGRGVKPYDGSIMFRRWDEDEGKMERPWVDAFGLPRTDEQMKGRRFFALDNLKETP